MLKIRPEQFAVFQKASSESFQDRMVSHIKQFFPQSMEQLGEPAIRDLIHYGIQRSATYQFRLEPDVCNYIDFMVVFGRDFDRDPALPWASSILNNPSLQGPSVRVAELHKAAAALESSQGGE